MDFSFNETQLDVQQLASKVLSSQSTTERLNEIDLQEDRFDQRLWELLAEAGLLGVAFSEKNGGMGMGFTELCILAEEVGRYVAAIPIVPVITSTALPIQRFGSSEQQQRFLPAIASGKMLITAGLSEALAECPSQPLTTAIADGDNYLLTGTKIAVPFAHKAERILVSAKVDDGVAIFLLDPDTKGVELTRQVSTTREPWYEVTMTNAAVSVDDLLLDADRGASGAKWIAERTMAAYSAMQLGVVDQAMRITAEYTCGRIQFDVPIGSFQAVQHRAADCFIDVLCLKLTAYQAISLLNDEKEASPEVLIAKIWAGDAGHRVSYASQHLHGGTGIDKNYHLWRYCLWARQLEVLLGSSAYLLSELGKMIALGEAHIE